jgi:Fe-S-cluster-containing hydrogenase component 2
VESNSVPTYYVAIHIAGDAEQAKQVCREHCYAVGMCVTVTPTSYIYTGGEEQGVTVRLVNYPRFPSDKQTVLVRATELAARLMARLCQHSYMLETPDETKWVSRRDECSAAK